MARGFSLSQHDAERVIKLKCSRGWGSRRIVKSMPYLSRGIVMRVIRFYLQNGVIPYRHFDNPNSGLNERERRILVDLLDLDPTLFLDELASKLHSVTGIYKCESQICRSLQKMGLTLKVVSSLAIRRSADATFFNSWSTAQFSDRQLTERASEPRSVCTQSSVFCALTKCTGTTLACAAGAVGPGRGRRQSWLRCFTRTVLGCRSPLV